jgi:Zn-dependent peptidase ImmA (M78 family)/transcriptional regulator with XRE-family HTH domain
LGLSEADGIFLAKLTFARLIDLFLGDMPMDTFTQLVGERIRLAREGAGLSQEKLTEALGFNDRQTLSTIELGQRRVSAEELVRFAKALGQTVDYFTDPYRVAGADAFSYRAKRTTAAALRAFELKAGNLIAAQRRFQELLSRPPSPAQPQIAVLTPRASLDFATLQGERCAAAWQLGEAPALRLREAAAQNLGVVVLHVDAPRTISGAACRLADGAYVLINRAEPAARRNFDLGHELFHILTWDKMPPPRVDQIPEEGPTGGKRPKVERLADAFTAGLLMPTATVQSRWAQRGDQGLAEWLSANARELGVSHLALYWRLANLGLIKSDADTLHRVDRLRSASVETRPAPYSADFVRDLHTLIADGLVTVRRVLTLLDLDEDELKGIFTSYQMEPPFDL